MKRRLGPVSQPQVAVRFDDEDRAILEAVAKAERLSCSDIVRRAVRAYAKALGIEIQAHSPKEAHDTTEARIGGSPINEQDINASPADGNRVLE